MQNEGYNINRHFYDLKHLLFVGITKLGGHGEIRNKIWFKVHRRNAVWRIVATQLHMVLEDT